MTFSPKRRSVIYFVFIIPIAGRKKSPLDPSCCPVCGITLRSSDLEAHFVQELERLDRISRTYRPSSSNSLGGNAVNHHHHNQQHSHHHSPSPSGSAGLSTPGATTQVHKREQDTRWETFHRIRLNRTNRVRAKARKRRADERDDVMSHDLAAAAAAAAAGCSGTPCPICGQRMYGSAEELNQHVVQCLRRVSGSFLYIWNVHLLISPY